MNLQNRSEATARKRGILNGVLIWVFLSASSAYLSVSAVRSIQIETTTSPQETQRNAEEALRVTKKTLRSCSPNSGFL